MLNKNKSKITKNSKYLLELDEIIIEYIKKYIKPQIIKKDGLVLSIPVMYKNVDLDIKDVILAGIQDANDKISLPIIYISRTSETLDRNIYNYNATDFEIINTNVTANNLKTVSIYHGLKFYNVLYDMNIVTDTITTANELKDTFIEFNNKYWYNDKNQKTAFVQYNDSVNNETTGTSTEQVKFFTNTLVLTVSYKFFKNIETKEIINKYSITYK